jgi:hypothetical protein
MAEQGRMMELHQPGGFIMNSNQRSSGNNQSSNGANEKSVSQGSQQSQQQNQQNQQNQQSQQNQQNKQGQNQQNKQSGRQGSQQGSDSTRRPGSQTGAEQVDDVGSQHYQGDSGYAGNRQSQETDKFDDTGLSNTRNMQGDATSAKERQAKQSNVGRRDDGTPD